MYKDCSIPAKMFFSILSSQDFTEVSKENFDDIFDEYFTLDDDQTIKHIYDKRKSVALLKLKITVIANTIDAIVNFPMTKEQRLKIIDVLDEKLNIKLDKDKPLLEQCNRILRVKLGGLQNMLTLETSTLKNLSKGKKATFEDNLVAFENVLERQINEDLTLYKFISYKKSCNQKIKKHRNG